MAKKKHYLDDANLDNVQDNENVSESNHAEDFDQTAPEEKKSAKKKAKKAEKRENKSAKKAAKKLAKEDDKLNKKLSKQEEKVAKEDARYSKTAYEFIEKQDKLNTKNNIKKSKKEKRKAKFSKVAKFFEILGVILVLLAGIALAIYITLTGECKHKYEDTVVEPTCTSEGYTLHVCSKCGDEYKDTETSVKAHNYAEAVSKLPTCTEEGSKTLTCKDCQATEIVSIPKDTDPNSTSAHTFVVKNTVLATCTTKGYTVYVCACGLTKNADYTDEIDHSYNETVTLTPTCSVLGSKTLTCEVCGDEKTEAIPLEPTAHNYSNVTVIAPTCASAGYTLHSCSCGASYTTDNKAKLEHAWTVDSETPATCTENGSINYKCTNAGCTETKSRSTAALGHDTASNATIEVSRVPGANGCEYTVTYNTACNHTGCQGITTTRVEVSHKYVCVIVTEATCMTPAVKSYKCSVCNALDPERTNISDSAANPNAHAWDNGTVVGNVTTYVCQHNSEHTKEVLRYEGTSANVDSSALKETGSVKLDSAEFDFDEDVKANLADGEVEISADTVDTDALKVGKTEEEIQKLEEELAEVGDAPIYDFNLSVGGQSVHELGGKVTITLPYNLATGEDPENIVIWYVDETGSIKKYDSTPENGNVTYANGYVTFETDHFSHYIVIRLTPEQMCETFGHKYASKTYAPTCTENGYVMSVCTRCGDISRTDGAAATGHTYTETVTDPTCYEDGYTVFTCHCGYTYTDNYTDKLGHSWDNGVVTPATCTSKGYTTYTCTNGCGEIYTDNYTDFANHTYTTEGKCSVCGAACTHNFGAYSYNNDATCVKNGTESATCSTCGYVSTRVKQNSIVAHTYDNGVCSGCGLKCVHEWSEFVSNNDKTCEKDGTKSHTCAVCALTETVTDEGTAIGHNFTNGVCTNCGDGCDHIYGDYVSDNNATCTENGTKSRTCSVCSIKETVTEENTAKGHSFTNYVSDGNATCTLDGTKTAKCDRCDVTDTKADENSKLGHSFITYVSNNDATCTENGTETAKCDRCDVTDTKVDEDSKLGHSFTAYVSNNDATCTENGTETAKCDRCDVTDTKVDEDSKLGHSFITYVSNNDATCTENGTETAKCDRCDTTDTKVDEDSKLGHTMSDATCTEAPVCTRENCSYTEGEALGHSFTNYVYNNDATCTKDGTETAKCDRCDVTDTVTKAGTKLPHNYNDENVCTNCGDGCDHEWTEYVYNNDATCTEDGTKTHNCTLCSASETINADGTKLGHTFSNYVYNNDATCTEDGTETSKCDRCDVTDTKTTVGSKLGHVMNEATCTTPANCGRENCSYTEGEALGHSFTNYVSNNDATCTENGTETAKCDRCDVTDTKADEGSKLGHSFTNYVSNNDATCTENGTETAKCDRCDVKDTKTVENSKLGHSFTTYVSNNDATCTENGTETAKCDRCDVTDTKTVENSKLGHSFTTYVSNNDATCTLDGTKTAKCDRCDVTDTKADEGSKLGHSFTAYVSNNDATCTVDGTKTAKCDRCDVTDTKADEGSKLGHSFTNYVSNNDATCTEDGTKTAKCDRCDATDTKKDSGTKLPHNYGEDGKCSCGASLTTTGFYATLLESIRNKDSFYIYLEDVSIENFSYTENGSINFGSQIGDYELSLEFDENGKPIVKAVATYDVNNNGVFYTVTVRMLTKNGYQYLEVITDYGNGKVETSYTVTPANNNQISLIFGKMDTSELGDELSSMSELLIYELLRFDFETIAGPLDAIFDMIFTRVATEDGYALTLDVAKIRELNDYLNEESFATFVDRVFGEGTFDSILEYIEDSLDKTMDEVVRDARDYLDELGIISVDDFNSYIEASGVTIEEFFKEAAEYRFDEFLCEGFHIESTSLLESLVKYGSSKLRSFTVYEVVKMIFTTNGMDNFDIYSEVNAMLDTYGADASLTIYTDEDGNLLSIDGSLSLLFESTYNYQKVSGSLTLTADKTIEDDFDFVSSIFPAKENITLEGADEKITSKYTLVKNDDGTYTISYTTSEGENTSDIYSHDKFIDTYEGKACIVSYESDSYSRYSYTFDNAVYIGSVYDKNGVATQHHYLISANSYEREYQNSSRYIRYYDLETGELLNEEVISEGTKDYYSNDFATKSFTLVYDNDGNLVELRDYRCYHSYYSNDGNNGNDVVIKPGYDNDEPDYDYELPSIGVDDNYVSIGGGTIGGGTIGGGTIGGSTIGGGTVVILPTIPADKTCGAKEMGNVCANCGITRAGEYYSCDSHDLVFEVALKDGATNCQEGVVISRVYCAYCNEEVTNIDTSNIDVTSSHSYVSSNYICYTTYKCTVCDSGYVSPNYSYMLNNTYDSYYTEDGVYHTTYTMYLLQKENNSEFVILQDNYSTIDANGNTANIVDYYINVVFNEDGSYSYAEKLTRVTVSSEHRHNYEITEENETEVDNGDGTYSEIFYAKGECSCGTYATAYGEYVYDKLTGEEIASYYIETENGVKTFEENSKYVLINGERYDSLYEYYDAQDDIYEKVTYEYDEFGNIVKYIAEHTESGMTQYLSESYPNNTTTVRDQKLLVNGKLVTWIRYTSTSGSSCSSSTMEWLDDNGDVLYTQTGSGNHSDIVYEYEYLTDSKNCEDGVIVKEVCKDCGEVISSYTTYYHEVNREVLFAGKYFSLYFNSCPCGSNIYYYSNGSYMSDSFGFYSEEMKNHVDVEIFYYDNEAVIIESYGNSSGCTFSAFRTIYVTYNFDFYSLFIYDENGKEPLGLNKDGLEVVKTINTSTANHWYEKQVLDYKEEINENGNTVATETYQYVCGSCGEKLSDACTSISIFDENDKPIYTETYNGEVTNKIEYRYYSCGEVSIITEIYDNGYSYVYWYITTYYGMEEHYELLVPGGSCEDGVIRVIGCPVCGLETHRDSYPSYKWHMNVGKGEVRLEEYGLCGGYVNSSSCLCGENANFDYYIYCRLYDFDEYDVEADGEMVHVVERRCKYCPIEYTITSKSVSNGCKITEIETINISANGMVIVENFERVNTYENHNIVREYEMFGESCDDGYYVIERCTKCDYNSSYKSSGHSYLDNLHTNFEDYDGCCDYHNIDFESCPCGKSHYCYFNYDNLDYDYETKTYSCRDCDLKITHYEDRTNDNCTVTATFVLNVSYGDVEILAKEYNYSYTSHSMKSSVKVNDEGETIIESICTGCGNEKTVSVIKNAELIENDGKYYYYEFTFTPEKTESYFMYSLLTEYVYTRVSVYDDNSNLICDTMYGGAYDNFFLRTNLEEGRTYTFRIRYEDGQYGTIPYLFSIDGAYDKCYTHSTHSVTTLLPGAASCEDGILEAYICVYCGQHTGYSLATYHRTTENYYNIDCNVYGSHSVRHDYCACGQNSNFYYDAWNLEEHNGVYTCRYCDFSIATITDKTVENCVAFETVTTVIKDGEVEIGSYSYSTSYTCHDYNTVISINGDGNYVISNVCSSCGLSNEVTMNQADLVYDKNFGGYYYDFYFTPDESANYIIYSLSNSDTCIYLYTADMKELAYNDDGGYNTNFRLSYYLEAGTTYIYRIRFLSQGSSGSINYIFTKGEDTSSDCYHNNMKSVAILLPDSSYCEDGIFVANICVGCGEIMNSYTTTSPYYTLYTEYDLTEYGACSNSFKLYNCLCGKHTHYEINSCGHTVTTNTRIDEEGRTVEVRRVVCEYCRFTYRHEYYTERDAATCTVTYYHSVIINVGDNLVDNFTYTTTAISHNYSITATLNDGAKDCLDGATLTYTCDDCGNSYTKSVNTHYQYVAEVIDLKNLGAVCEGYATLNTCACGKESHLSLDNAICEFDTYGINYWVEGALSGSIYVTGNYINYYNDAYMYVCAVTDPEQCAFRIRFQRYYAAEDGECIAYQYERWQFGYDPETDTYLYEVVYKTGESKTYHAYESTNIFETYENGSTKISGTRYTCPDCGTYYETTYYYYPDGNSEKSHNISENYLNDGQNKSYERIYEYKYDAEGKHYNSRYYYAYTYSNGSEYWYDRTYDYDYDYVADFGTDSYLYIEKYRESNGYEREYIYGYTYYNGSRYQTYYKYSEKGYWYEYNYTYDFNFEFLGEITYSKTTEYESSSGDTSTTIYAYLNGRDYLLYSYELRNDGYWSEATYTYEAGYEFCDETTYKVTRESEDYYGNKSTREYTILRNYYEYDLYLMEEREDGFWAETVWEYDFERGCFVTRTYIDSNGEQKVEEYNDHRTTYWSTVVNPRCTQPGEEGTFCGICHHGTDTWPISPSGHEWIYFSENVYYCRKCGMQNENGADGDIVIEDMTYFYGEGVNYVAGYWMRTEVKFEYFAVIITEDGEIIPLDVTVYEENDKFIGLWADKAEFEAAAEEMAMYYQLEKYQLSIMIVPESSDGSLVYAVVFEDLASIDADTTITGTDCIKEFIPSGEELTFTIAPEEDGWWYFYSTYTNQPMCVRLIDENGYILYEWWYTYQYNFDQYLEGGKTYTLVISWYYEDTYGYSYFYFEALENENFGDEKEEYITKTEFPSIHI